MNCYTGKGDDVETMMRFWAWLTRREMVWLIDHDGSMHLAIAKKTPSGLMCRRMSMVPHTTCMLTSGGTVKYGPSYVEAWRPYNDQVQP